MSMLEKMMYTVSSVLLKSDVSDYINVEIPYDDTTIDMADGSQLTVIRINGMRIYPGETEVSNAIEELATLLKSSSIKQGHRICTVFERDKEYTEREIDDVLNPMRNTAKNLGMNIEDILQERRDIALKNNIYEGNYLAIYTMPSVLGTNVKEVFKNRAERNRENYTKYRAEGAANVFAHIEELEHYHKTHLTSVMRSLSQAELDFDVLHVERAASVMGFMLERSVRSKHWRVRVPNGYAEDDGRRRTYLQRPTQHQEPENMLGAAPYSLADVLPANDHNDTDLDGKRLPPGVRRVGLQYYATMTVKFFPDQKETFNALFHLLGRETPYRIAFYIDGLDSGMLAISQMFRSFITNWADRRHPLAKLAYEEMQEEKAQGAGYARIQGQITTWSSTLKQLQANISQVQASISKWSSAEMMLYTPDPVEAYVSSIVGARINSPAPEHYAPVEDAAMYFPISRPASIWPRGSVQMTTPDNKMFPVSVVSSEMENNTILIIAKQRSGKSVLLNVFDFSLVFHEGLTRLPRMVTIDSAPSSKGKIDMLRQRLPEHLREQVLFYKMSNKKGGDKQNVFDLILGVDAPFPEHREFLNSFIMTMGTSLAAEKIPNGLPELINIGIDTTYERLRDTDDLSGGGAKLYYPGIVPEIDDVLQRILPAEKLPYIEVKNGKTLFTWYEVRDVLYQHRKEALAFKAQKHAVPTMEDFLRVLSTDQEINKMFDEHLIRDAIQNIELMLRELPMINGVSTLDLNNAKIIAMDLKDVTSSTGKTGQRQATLMYLLGIFIGTQLYFIDEDSRHSFNPLFTDYAERVIKECKEDVKRLCIDEYWRTGGLPGINQVVEMIERVGPKFNISMLLSSQNFKDYSDVLIEGAGGYILMGKPNDSTIDKVKNNIGLTGSALSLLKSNKFGTRKGEVFFIFDTAKGRYYQHLFLNVGPKELWSNSTTNADTTFRNYVINELGQEIGYTAMSKEYPGGTIEQALEALNNKRSQRESLATDDEKSTSLAIELAENLVQMYREKIIRGEISASV